MVSVEANPNLKERVMNCPLHGASCAGGGVFCVPGSKDYLGRNNGLWEKPLKDGTTLIGEKNSGVHTHIGTDFVKITTEKDRLKFIKWDI